MSDELFIPVSDNREVIYQALIPQMESLIAGENNFIANVANVMAALHQTFQFLWVGCYFVEDDTLVLGPFQGPVACTRIRKGKGVCGTAWQKNECIIVPDVNEFPGHIACSSLSKSEIVIPLRKMNGVVFGILDIDSSLLNDFSECDQKYLEQVAVLLAGCSID